MNELLFGFSLLSAWAVFRGTGYFALPVDATVCDSWASRGT